MKKYSFSLFIIFCLGFLSLGMSSCGDDDVAVNSKASMLYGETWSFSKAVVDVNGMKMNMSLNDIRNLYKNELGLSNVMFVDQYLRFDDTYMTLVNAGEKVKYIYYENGKLWFEGLDEINKTDGMAFDVSISSLTDNQLVIRYVIKVSGVSVTEDIYYTR